MLGTLRSLAFVGTLALLTTSAARASSDEPTLAVVADSGALGASADPNLDRGLVLPTAMTQPAGSLTYNNYELLLHGLTYGITDRLQVSGTVLLPIVESVPFVGNVAVKGRVIASDRFHLSVQGSLAYGEIRSWQSDSVSVVGAGPLATFCLRDDCSSLLSAVVTYQLLYADGKMAHLLLYGGSLIHRVGNHVKLIVEAASASGGSDEIESGSGLIFNYGVRFHGRMLAADVGFIKPIGAIAEHNDPFLLGIPFVNLSFRW